MAGGNKTLNVEYRFLSPKDFAELYKTSLEAFSDYIIPIRLSQQQFENHLAQNAVNLNLSVGAFSEDGRMIGYTINGFDQWNQRWTAYDAGTGVIPEYRNNGVGTALFEFLLPELRRLKTEQMLLEVLESNEIAGRLYRKLGFVETRRLVFFEYTNARDLKSSADVEIREIDAPEWDLLKTFWDGQTCWQFSCESIERKTLPKTIYGAFAGDEILGYTVLYQVSGVVPQIAVRPDSRRCGIGSKLLAVIKNKTVQGKALQFSNVDEALTGALEFIKTIGFTETIRQFEMIKTL